MRVNWKISKKRGNYRPSLNYTITLERFERELAINAVHVETRIPEVPNPHAAFCMPGHGERAPGWTPSRFHRIQVPWFKTGIASEFIRLPFRESGAYPEVEAAFRALREVYEAEVCAAYGQAPLEEERQLDMSAAARKQVAARVTAGRLLALFGSGGQQAVAGGESSEMPAEHIACQLKP